MINKVLIQNTRYTDKEKKGGGRREDRASESVLSTVYH